MTSRMPSHSWSASPLPSSIVPAVRHVHPGLHLRSADHRQSGPRLSDGHRDPSWREGQPPDHPRFAGVARHKESVAMSILAGDVWSAVCAHTSMIRPVIPRTPEGCEECLRTGSPWLHLRLCLTCGHVGCCDSSPGKHARRHAHASDIRSSSRLSPVRNGGGATTTRRTFECRIVRPTSPVTLRLRLPQHNDRWRMRWRPRWSSRSRRGCARFQADPAQPGGGRLGLHPPRRSARRRDGVTVYMDVPALRAENLDIELENDVLTIRGERPFPYAREDGKGPVRRIERGFGRFERTLRVRHERAHA